MLSDIALEKGLSIMALQGANNNAGDHMIFAPAFIVTEKDVEEMVSKAKDVFAQLEKELAHKGLI